jgi:cyclopropane fatty-acyl-phospholipid synthase-like methyltransferase
VAVVSVPCGLVRDLCTVHKALRVHRTDLGRRLRLFGLDLDHEGRVLDEAQRRARAAGVPIRLVQANALEDAPWTWLRQTAGWLTVVNCIGLSPWLSPEEMQALLRRCAEHLRPGGQVLLDRFNQGKHNKLGEQAEILAHYHTDEDYRAYVRAAGLTVQTWEHLGEHEGMGYVLRKPGP